MWKKFNKWLLEWKPIHLCWWFEKHNLPIPKYFIGGPAVAPTVTVSAASSILENRADGNGNVTSDGGATVTERGFVWSTSSTPTTSSYPGGGKLIIAGTTGAYSGTMSSPAMVPNTLYYYRAYATNSKGTGYGGTTGTQFTTYNTPTVALNTPSDNATGVSTTPDLLFTGTAPDSQELEYNVQVDTVNSFDSQGSVITQDSYTGTAALTDSVYSGAKIEVAQSFTASANGPITSCIFKVRKWGSPPSGNVTCKLYAHSGTYGTSSVGGGTLLATSDTRNIDTLNTSGAEEEFTFSGAEQYSLVNGTTYVISIGYGGAGDLSNNLQVYYINSDATDGNNSTLTGSTWTAQATRDSYFSVKSSSTAPLLSKLSVTPDATFAGTGDPHPWPSGNQVTYTVQGSNALTAGVDYWWRVAATTTGAGSAGYGAWPTAFKFTTEAGSTNVTVNAATTTKTFSVPAPTVTAVRNVTVAIGAALAIAFSSPAATASTPINVTANATTITKSFSVQAPTVTAIRNVSVSATVEELTSAVQSPTVTTTRNVSTAAGVQSQSFTVPAPTVTAIRNVTVQPTTEALTFTAFAPTVSNATNVQISAVTPVLTFSVPVPTVTAQRNVTVSVTASTLTSSAPSATATAIRNATASVTAPVLTSSIPPPTVTAVRNVSTAVTTQTLTSSVPAATVSAVRNVTASVTTPTLTSSVPAVTVTAIRNVTVSATAVTGTLSVPDASVSVAGATEVRPNSQTLSFMAPAVTVTAIRNVTVQATIVTQTFTVPDATVSTAGNVSVSATTPTATFSVPDVTVTGSATATPDTVLLTSSVPDLTVTVTRNVSVSADICAVSLSAPVATATGSSSVVNVTVYPDVIDLGRIPSLVFDLDGNPYLRVTGVFYQKV